MTTLSDERLAEIRNTTMPNFQAASNVATLLHEIDRLRARNAELVAKLEAARPKRPVYERHEGWKGGSGPDVWMAAEESGDGAE